MLSNISSLTTKLTEENENDSQVLNNHYLTCSNLEQTENSSTSDESSSSDSMGEIEGRRIYCSGRDLHTISSVN